MTAQLAKYLASEEAVSALRHARQALAAMSDCLDPIFQAMNETSVPHEPDELAQSMAIVHQMAILGKSNFDCDAAILVLLSLSSAFGGETDG